jgi:hypothetical protein
MTTQRRGVLRRVCLLTSTSVHEAFVAQRNHVGRIKTLDVSTDGRCPVSDNGSGTAIAAWLIGQFPGEYRTARTISTDNRLYICLVLCLDCGVSVPSSFVGSVVSIVGRHSTIITPVIDKVDDELDAMGLRAGDHIIQTLEPVGSCVDDWRCS